MIQPGSRSPWLRLERLSGPWRTVTDILSARLLLLVVLLSLGSCSSQALYDRLDWFARLYVQRYVDLDPSQTGWLALNLAEWAAWHRQEELPRYVSFLQRLEQDLGNAITPDTVDAWTSDLRGLYTHILEKSTPSLVELAERLSEDQIDEFLQKLEQRSQKEDKRYLSRDERRYREDIRDQIGERLEYWLGGLTPMQESRIEETVEQYHRLDQEWMDANRQWRQQLAEVLTREPGWRDRLSRLILARNEYLEDATNIPRVENERLVYLTITDVLNMRNKKQDRKLSERLRKWGVEISRMHDGQPATSS